jgi:hypothetical protein
MQGVEKDRKVRTAMKDIRLEKAGQLVEAARQGTNEDARATMLAR